MSFVDLVLDFALDRPLGFGSQLTEKARRFLSANVLQTVSVLVGLV